MSWNYRVIKHVYEEEEFFQIHEVYYDDNENPHSMTEEGIVPYGDTTEELSRSMIHMMGALIKPVLDAKSFGPDPDPNATISTTLGLLNKNI